MNIGEKKVYISKIVFLLQKRYKTEMHISLDFDNPWELLVSTMLSAQTTDTSVNGVTPELFRRYKNIQAFLKLKPTDLYDYTRRIGLYKSKSKNIINSAKMIINDFEGIVPQTMKELVMLPGIGRKTANVVLYYAFGKTFGIAIDTHCVTVSNRLNLSRTTNPKIIEEELMRIVEKRYWGKLTSMFIALGRDVCTSRRKHCENCVLNKICLSSIILK